MAYKLFIKPKAEAEMIEAIEWYLNKDPNLGRRFAEVIKNSLHQIQEDPEHFQKKYRNIRINYTKIFSYGIHYIIEKKTIFVLAILHTSRKPRE